MALKVGRSSFCVVVIQRRKARQALRLIGNLAEIIIGIQFDIGVGICIRVRIGIGIGVGGLVVTAGEQKKPA